MSLAEGEVNTYVNEFKLELICHWLKNINPDEILPLKDSFIDIPLRLTVKDLEMLTHFSDLNDAITEADIYKEEVEVEGLTPFAVTNKTNEVGRGRGRGQRISFDENFISRQLKEHIGVASCQILHQGRRHWLSNKTILSGQQSSAIRNVETVVKKIQKKKIVDTCVKEADVYNEVSSGSYITCNSN